MDKAGFAQASAESYRLLAFPARHFDIGPNALPVAESPDELPLDIRFQQIHP